MKIKNNKRRKGFTLIELIVVIAILAILAAVAVPNFIGLTAKARISTEVAGAAEFANAVNIYNTMNETDIDQADVTAMAKTDAGIIALLGADLAPKFDSSDAAYITAVIARIGFDANGLCYVATRT